MTRVKQGHMALKEIRKEIAYPNNLPIRLWPFAFNQLLWPCDLSQIRLYGLKIEPENNCVPLQVSKRPFAFI